MPKDPNVLAVDVGGSNVKVRLSTDPSAEVRRAPSGPGFTAGQCTEAVRELAGGWDFDAVTVGVPAPVRANRVTREPVNLGAGWAGFDFAEAFGIPAKVINDAAMQAIGSYEGRSMMFCGLGTGLGTAMVVDHRVIPLEVSHLPYSGEQTYEDAVCLRSLERLGVEKWTEHVFRIGELFLSTFLVDEVVLGGGNARLLSELPRGFRLGQNDLAFEGGFRMWDAEAPIEILEEGAHAASRPTISATLRD